MHLVKDICHELAEALAYLVNLSIMEGIFSKTLKQAGVTPVYKKGNPDQVGNCRPISVLSVISKIFERLLCCRIVEFLNKFGWMMHNHHGFWAGCSTEVAAFRFI